MHADCLPHQKTKLEGLKRADGGDSSSSFCPCSQRPSAECMLIASLIRLLVQGRRPPRWPIRAWRAPERKVAARAGGASFRCRGGPARGSHVRRRFVCGRARGARSHDNALGAAAAPARAPVRHGIAHRWVRADCMLIAYSLHLHSLHTHCTPIAHSLHTHCTPIAHSLHTHCTLAVAHRWVRALRGARGRSPIRLTWHAAWRTHGRVAA